MNAAHTAWVLVCTALVLLMTPGLAFFYGGLVREGHVVNTIKMSFAAIGVVALLWIGAGYSLAFAPGSPLLGTLAWAGLDGLAGPATSTYAPEVPHLAFMAFQMMFAILTPALISGAVVGRMKFRSYLAFIACWSLGVYVPVAHWVWGEGGWIRALGALDFAGGTVVHVTAGISALVAARVIGPRRRPVSADEDRPHNVPMVILGASLLWFGWFGFNAGSAFAADGIAALAVVTTMVAGAAAVVTWIAIEVAQTGRPTATGAAIGAVVGLVAITPAAGYVSPVAALGIGAAGAAASTLAMMVMRRTRLDDALDVFACHGVAGIIGSLLTGVLASPAVNPVVPDERWSLVAAQGLAVLAAGGYAAVATTAILLALRVTIGLRVTDLSAWRSVDFLEHAEPGYRWDHAQPTPVEFTGANGDRPVPPASPGNDTLLTASLPRSARAMPIAATPHVTP